MKISHGVIRDIVEISDGRMNDETYKQVGDYIQKAIGRRMDVVMSFIIAVIEDSELREDLCLVADGDLDPDVIIEKLRLTSKQAKP